MWLHHELKWVLMQKRASRRDEWGEKKKRKRGQIPASDTFKDEHNDMEHLSEKQTWIVLILRWGVRGPFQQNKIKNKNKHEDIIPETKKENKQSGVQRGVGINDDDVKLENNKYSKLQSQALKSLKKAAVAVFPLPDQIQPNVCQVSDILLFHGVQ